MNEEQRATTPEVGELLRRLPRTQASPGFRETVLARAGDRREPSESARVGRGLGGEPGSRRWLSGRNLVPLGIAAAIVLSVVLGTVLGVAWRRPDASPEAVRAQTPAPDLEELRREYRALEDELAELRRLVADAQPVVGLSGSDQVDVVIDLRELARERGLLSGLPLAPLPASGETQSRAIPVRYR